MHKQFHLVFIVIYVEELLPIQALQHWNDQNHNTVHFVCLKKQMSKLLDLYFQEANHWKLYVTFNKLVLYNKTAVSFQNKTTKIQEAQKLPDEG